MPLVTPVTEAIAFGATQSVNCSTQSPNRQGKVPTSLQPRFENCNIGQ